MHKAKPITQKIKLSYVKVKWIVLKVNWNKGKVK